ncbi:DUF63 family protein [Methanocaldococcus infernus]
MLKELKEFIYKYYIEPAETGSGYNLVQEITYGLILALFLYLFYKGLKKLNIKIDEKFVIPGVIFTILIALMRALVDLGYIERSFLTITPGIVFLVGGFYIITILITGYFFRDNYYKVSSVVGLIPLIYFFIIFLQHVKTALPIILSLFLVTLFLGMAYLINKRFKIFNSKIDYLTLLGQLVDGAATTIGIGIYGYLEQHPIPRFLMEHFTPISFIVVKFTIVTIILYILNKEEMDPDLRNIIKLIIMALGLAPGLRDLFRTIMGV